MSGSKNNVPWYDKIEKFFIVIEMLGCLAILAVNVFTRYVLSYTSSWSEQAARLLFVWMTFTGVSLCGMTAGHLQVTVVELFSNKKLVDLFFWIGDIVAVVFSLFISTKIAAVFMTVYKSKQMLTGIPWMPAWVLYLPGVLGMIGFSLRTIQRRYRVIKNKDRNIEVQLAGKEGTE